MQTEQRLNRGASPTPSERVGSLQEFQVELFALWRQLPNKGLFFGLLAAWLLLFHYLGSSTFGYMSTRSIFGWMRTLYMARESEDSHGLLIPLVVLALLWWKRKQLFAQPLRAWWPGLMILGLGMILHLLGYAIQQPRVSIVGLFAGIYGLTGLAWGPWWLRASFFPFFLFAFCVPFGSLAQPLSFPLRLLVCRLTERVAHFVLGMDLIREGTRLMDPSGLFQYEVAAACSGMRSLVAIFVLATVYAFVTTTSLWKRLVLMASAFPLAVIGNLSRMVMIVVAAELGGQQAGNFVHENAVFSLVPYVPAIFGLMLLGRWLETANDRKSGRRP
jgi:exosortase